MRPSVRAFAISFIALLLIAALAGNALPPEDLPLSTTSHTDTAITSPAVGSLTLTGGSSATALDLGSYAAADIEAPITFTETKNLAVEGLEMDVWLVDAFGGKYYGKWIPDAGKTALAAGEILSGTLKFTLPAAGKYTGQIIATYPKPVIQQRFPITITRVDRETPLEVGDLGEYLVEKCPCGSSHADVATTIRTLNGAALTVPQPSITAIRRFKDDKPIGVENVTAEFLDTAGQTTTSVSATQARTQVRLRIGALGDPGRYEAKLHFTPNGYGKPIEKLLAVYVKDSWLAAAAMILAGVVVSAILRWWFNRRRPLLLFRRRHLQILEQLEQDIAVAGNDEEARRLITDVREGVNHVAGEQTTLDKFEVTAFDVSQKKIEILRSWISASALVNGAQPESVRIALRKKLNEVAAALRDPIIDAAGLGPHRKTLNDFRTTIDQAITDEAKNLLDALDVEISNLEAIDANLANAHTASGDARQALNAGNVADALKHLDKARRALVEALATKIRADLAGQPPAGFDQASWTALKAMIDPILYGAVNESDANRVLTRFYVALEAFVRALYGGVERSLAGAAINVAAVRALLDSATTKLAEKKIAAAWLDVAAAQKELSPAVRERASKSIREIVFGTLPSAPESAHIPPDDVTSADVTRELVIIDVLVAVAIAVIATIVGVKLLWADVLVWGTWTDYLAALLWGLGLHQFTYSGMTSLVNQLKT